jgi:hypothetical protein
MWGWWNRPEVIEGQVLGLAVHALTSLASRRGDAGEVVFTEVAEGRHKHSRRAGHEQALAGHLVGDVAGEHAHHPACAGVVMQKVDASGGGQYQPLMSISGSLRLIRPLMAWHCAEPGAPVLVCVSMKSCATPRLVCTVHVVCATLAGRWAKALPATRRAAAATASLKVLNDFMMGCFLSELLLDVQ